MIELYASTSPNVSKVEIMLEETGLDYRVRLVDVHKGEQHTPEFAKLNPNRKVPVIVDQDGPDGRDFTLFESGAILFYLAEKTGKLLPVEPAARATTIQWLMVQMSGIGPTFGQFNHFFRYATDDIYSRERFTSQARLLYDLLNLRLGQAEYLAGDAYTIADIATFPWIRAESRLFGERHPVMSVDWPGHPNLTRWFKAIAARPAVERAICVLDKRPSSLKTATSAELARYHVRGEYRRTLDEEAMP